jgi:hypothetical protein
MMLPVLLLAAVQGGLPTVGDTVWVERRVVAPSNVLIRPQAWDLGSVGRQLGPAVQERTGSGLVVRYPLVFWYPGRHSLRMPGPVVISREGRSDTLLASTVVVEVTSVLPAGRAREALEPRPARGPVAQSERNIRPLVILLALVVLSIAGLALRLRRRGKTTARPKGSVVRPAPERLAQWAAAGEYHAALDHWEHRLALKLRQSGGLEEMGRVQHVLEAIALAAYEPRAPDRLAELCVRAAQVEEGR